MSKVDRITILPSIRPLHAPNSKKKRHRLCRNRNWCNCFPRL